MGRFPNVQHFLIPTQIPPQKAARLLKKPSPLSGQQASQAPKQTKQSMQNSVHSLFSR